MAVVCFDHNNYQSEIKDLINIYLVVSPTGALGISKILASLVASRGIAALLTCIPGNREALIYTFDLGSSFNSKTTNITGLFSDLSKSGGFAANNIAPNYVDGAILSNDNEYILYGYAIRFSDAVSEHYMSDCSSSGLIRASSDSDPPNEDEILRFENYLYGREREGWEPGFQRSRLSDGVNRYVAGGASVSAPSENLGFYFSGVRGADWGPIIENDYSANTTSDRLITVDMSTMREEVWSNDTLSDKAPGRVNGELVWIPVSEAGVLVAIGGVINAEDTFMSALNDSQIEESVSRVIIASIIDAV